MSEDQIHELLKNRRHRNTEDKKDVASQTENFHTAITFRSEKTQKFYLT